MFTTSLCGPAIIYIGFSLIQIIIDIYKGVYNNAFIKFIVMIILSTVINILCNLGYTVIAWFFVFIPIVMMTIVSTLLFKVFGTNPDKKDLRSKVVDASNNDKINDLDDLHLSGRNLLNQQKYALYYDKFNSVERVDRDVIRKRLYDKIDDVYDLESESKETKYDLSNNPIKFYLANSFLNTFGENYFFQRIISSKLFNDIFTYNNYNLNDILNNYNNKPYTSSYKDLDIRADNMNGSDFTSYSDMYNDNYLLDGELLYRQNKFNSVKRELQKSNPNVSAAYINKVIERRWNNLSAAEQETWNKTAEKNNSSNNKTYNPDNLERYRKTLDTTYRSSLNKNANNEPCPVNETPQSFKNKTGLNCYEVCAPGKERNSLGMCVRPCPSGKERKIINGECQDI